MSEPDPGRLEIRPAGAPYAEVLATLHQPCFPHPWSAEEFQQLLAAGAQAWLVLTPEDPAGFILCRGAADEAEVLTLAAIPSQQNLGMGRRLLEAAASALAKTGTRDLGLEVADDNVPARRLYQSAGFIEVGRRKGYYRGPDGQIDALVLRRTLSSA